MRKHHDAIGHEEILYICTRLFERSSRKDMHDRLLIITQFQCLGRIAEVCSMFWSDICLDESEWQRLFCIMLNRTKTLGIQEEMQVVVHAKHWQVIA